MRERQHEIEDRLSEYLDGELEGAEARAVGAHLEACAACRRVLEELSAVRTRAGGLEDRPPERDLWPGIREELDRGRVIDLTDHLVPGTRRSGGARRQRRGVFLSVPQLGAAAAALVVLAAGGAWGLARSTAADGAPGPEVAAAAGAEGAGPAEAVEDLVPRFAEHEAEVAALQDALRRGRDRLDPNTVRILEKNLALIDGAIRESVEALAVDPGNPFVERHLQRSFDRKVTYLREAAALLEMTD